MIEAIFYIWLVGMIFLFATVDEAWYNIVAWPVAAVILAIKQKGDEE